MENTASELALKDINLFYPDCLFDPSQIYLSSCLYFPGNISLTTHPTSHIYTTGCDPFYFAQLVETNSPPWRDQFLTLFNLWYHGNDGLYNTFKILQPLHGNTLNKIILAYPRTEEALSNAEKLAKSTGLSNQQLMEIVDIPMAAEEFIAHLLYEQFLVFYESKIDNSKGYPDPELPYEDTRAKNIDYIELYQYCDGLFRTKTIEDILIGSYFFRLGLHQYFPQIMLSNDRLIDFLSLLPNHGKKENIAPSYYQNIDIIGWEIFRQITSPYIDPKSPEARVNLILDIKTKNSGEVETFKIKCLKLAEQYKAEKDPANFSENIAQHIKINTEKEIKDLLNLDRRQVSKILDLIFSDQKSWLAFGAFLFSIIGGGPLFTAGAALAAVSNVGAKTYKTISETEDKINESEYSLIYRLNKR